MDRLIADFRYALRALRKSPGFTAAAVLTLGLGIGANVAIFTLVDSILLRPLPYAAPDQLVRLLRTAQNAPYRMFSYPDLQDVRDEATRLSEVAGYARGRWPLTGLGEPTLLSTLRVTEGFFPLLGVQRPLLGRLLQPSDYAEDADRVVVLSYETWRGRFGGDSTALGRVIRLADRPATIVGVLPAGAAGYPDAGVQIWTTARPTENGGRGSRWLDVIGRLQPGVPLAEAQAEATVIARRLAAQYPEANSKRTITIEPLREWMVADVSTLFWILAAAVGAILLIACANVTNLLLSRATARRREIAVRITLGAGRRRIVAQLLTESVILALLGGALGLFMGTWTVSAFLAVSPGGVPRQAEVGLHGTVLLFAIALSLLTGLVAGLAPALGMRRAPLVETLKEGAPGAGVSRGRRRVRSALAMGQIALSLVLLTSAGLLLKSFWLLLHVDRGYHGESVAAVNIFAPASRYPDRASVLRLYDRLTDATRAIPGVQAVAEMSMVPLSGDNLCMDFIPEGQSDSADQCAETRAVSPGAFRVLGIPIVTGRAFDERDRADAPHVAVVDETLARRFWPEGDAIGRHLELDDESWEIVGIAGPVRYRSLDREPQPTIYVPEQQRPLRLTNVLARTTRAPATLILALRRAIWAVDPDLPIVRLDTLDGLVSESAATPRFRAALLGALAALALVLAAIGVYGVVAYDVSRRTREIGIRVALGARGSDVLRQVLGQALRLTVVGLAIGLVGALLVTRALEAFLFRVEPVDPEVFLAVGAFLAMVVVLATYGPARRASQADPMVALREE